METKESKDLKLSKNDNEMVRGIIDIINQVKDVENKKQIARNMIKQFKRENIDFNYDEFLNMCGCICICKTERPGAKYNLLKIKLIINFLI